MWICNSSAAVTKDLHLEIHKQVHFHITRQMNHQLIQGIHNGEGWDGVGYAKCKKLKLYRTNIFQSSLLKQQYQLQVTSGMPLEPNRCPCINFSNKKPDEKLLVPGLASRVGGTAIKIRIHWQHPLPPCLCGLAHHPAVTELLLRLCLSVSTRVQNGLLSTSWHSIVH